MDLALRSSRLRLVFENPAFIRDDKRSARAIPENGEGPSRRRGIDDALEAPVSRIMRRNRTAAREPCQDARIDLAPGFGDLFLPRQGLSKMLRVLSTHLFLNHRLHPGLLELAERSGAQAVEIFAARQHFDYTSREHVSELAEWFRSNTLQPFSMHAPLFPDREMGRAGAPGVNVLHPEKARRIDAMDEIKRALEAAELIPFSNLVLHLGERNDGWSQRTIEYAISALEHLGAFAHPLGVRLLVENLLSDATTPRHLLTVLDLGHLSNVGICLDLGHAHITVGVAEAIATLGTAYRHCACTR